MDKNLGTFIDIEPAVNKDNDSVLADGSDTAISRSNKKRRTVTFAEMDATKLDENGDAKVLYTIIPPSKYENSEQGSCH
ncbi:unnamed protein product [Caenorhabditis bovis]|uniref:Uncharacterized protein n=1 Tax=Caenorhabditis bovis TaxID=2654633 RepID=A0A8S1EMU5_9PELO|nr:unnamed protein product [Caenorhabditis bovis]